MSSLYQTPLPSPAQEESLSFVLYSLHSQPHHARPHTQGPLLCTALPSEVVPPVSLEHNSRREVSLALLLNAS